MPRYARYAAMLPYLRRRRYAMLIRCRYFDDDINVAVIAASPR